MPIAPIYAASKAALVHFVRSAAPLLARRGVRLCAVCPQPVDTPMVQAMMSHGFAMPQDTGASLITPERVSPPYPVPNCRPAPQEARSLLVCSIRPLHAPVYGDRGQPDARVVGCSVIDVLAWT